MNTPLRWRLNEIPRPAAWLILLLGSQVAALSANFSKVGLTQEGGSDVGRLVAILPGQLLFGTMLFCLSPHVFRLLKRPEAAAIALWMAWGLFTLFWSIDARQTTILSIGAMNLFIIALWLTYFFDISAFADISTTAISLVVVGGVYWQWFTSEGPGFDGRFEGLAAGFNQQGAICSFGILFALIGIKSSDKHRRLKLFAAIGLLLGLVLTGGRTSLAATLLAAAVLYWRELFDVRYRRYILPAIVAVGASIMTVLATAEIYQRSEDASALNGRDLVWGHSIDLILEAPIAGHGMMAGGAIWQAAEQSGVVDFSAGGAHNTALEVLVGAGVIGLVFYAIAMAVLFRSLMRTRSEIGLSLASLVALLGLTESLVHRPTMAYWALGAAVALALRAVEFADRTAPVYDPVFAPEPIPIVGKAKVGRFG